MNVEKERQVMEDVIRTLDRRENENLPQVQLTKTEVHCSLLAPLFNHGRINSVVRAHYCRAGGRGFDSSLSIRRFLILRLVRFPGSYQYSRS